MNMVDVNSNDVARANVKKELTKPFIFFHATSVNGGAMAIAATIASYFTLYVQETVQITAAELSVILLICSLWDAINDPLMGVLCDSVNPKAGRYRIWFVFTPIFQRRFGKICR